MLFSVLFLGLSESYGINLILIFIFCIIGITDIIDGVLARKLNQTTDFGKLADPAVDKIVQIIISIVFLLKDYNLILPILISIFIECLLMILSVFVLTENKKYVQSNKIGKIISILYFIIILLILLFNSNMLIMFYAITFLSFVRFVYYCFVYIKNKV